MSDVILAGGDAGVLKAMNEAFADVDRPEHFTNFQHCDECWEHDELLRNRDRDTLTIEDVGSMGWNPITFATPLAFAYYLPALARLALDPMPVGRDWYGYIILFELRRDGPRNDRWLWCSQPRRDAVQHLLEHLYTTRSADITTYDCAYELLEALEIWSEGDTPGDLGSDVRPG